jgi:hypothetical protein
MARSLRPTTDPRMYRIPDRQHPSADGKLHPVSLGRTTSQKAPSRLRIWANGTLFRERSKLAMTTGIIHMNPDGARSLLWCTGTYRDTGNTVEMVWLVDPMKPAPEFLLRDIRHNVPHADGKPRWEKLEILPGPKRGYDANWSLCSHGDELWLLRGETVTSPWGADALDLYGFLPGRTEAVHIPLRLEASAEDLKVMPQRNTDFLRHLTHPLTEAEGMVATSHGLAFSGFGCPGVWFIPWANVRKWEETHTTPGNVSETRSVDTRSKPPEKVSP